MSTTFKSYKLRSKGLVQATIKDTYLKAPIIWMFVRIISGFADLFFKSFTTSNVPLANRSSDKLGASDAEL